MRRHLKPHRLAQTTARHRHLPILLQFAFAAKPAKSSLMPNSMKSMTCIEDLRKAAKRRVPRAFFDYAEAGSYSEETLRANRADI